MSKPRQELYNYHNQALINEFNEFMIMAKVHLLNIEHPNIDKVKNNHPIPSAKDIDELTSKVMNVLKENKTPLIKK